MYVHLYTEINVAGVAVAEIGVGVAAVGVGGETEKGGQGPRSRNPEGGTRGVPVTSGFSDVD